MPTKIAIDRLRPDQRRVRRQMYVRSKASFEKEGPEVSAEASAVEHRVLLDKVHPAVYQAQLDVAKAVRHAAGDVGFDRKFVELLNVRVSQINRCAFCLDVHVVAALAAGESMQRVAILPAWRETALFTVREQAALTLVESITTLPDAHAQERDYEYARSILSGEEFSAVSWIALAMNAFNRLSIVSAHQVKAR